MKTKQQGSALILSIAILLAGTLLGKYFLTANQHYHDVFYHSLVDAKLQLQLNSYAQWAGGMIRQGRLCREITQQFDKLDLAAELKVRKTLQCSEQEFDSNSLVQYAMTITGEVGEFGSEMYQYKSIKVVFSFKPPNQLTEYSFSKGRISLLGL